MDFPKAIASFSQRLLSLTLAVLFVLLGTGAMEICRHADGHTHLLLAVGHCHGHSAKDASGCADSGNSFGALPHTHGDAPEEPCNHDSLTLDEEWVPAGVRATFTPSNPEWINHQGHVFTDFLRESAPLCSLFPVPRGPPAPGSGSSIFLRTTRLLI